MQKKTCKQCGKQFKAFKPEYELCPSCNKGETPSKPGGKPMAHRQQNRHQQGNRPSRRDSGGRYLSRELKLDSFYADNGALRKEIYVDVAEGIANHFKSENVTSSSIRRFYEIVRSAYESSQMDPNIPYDKVLEKIYPLRPQAKYSEDRGVTHSCFTDFINHYLDLVEKDKKNLRGFKELFMSVIGYSKK